MGFASSLPLTLHWYADGLAVVGATPAYAAVIGARMTTRAILQHFGMIAADGHVPVTFATVDGHTVTIPVGLGRPDAPRTDIGEALRITPPVYRGHPGAWYWSQYLQDSQTLFVQYNLCQNDAQHQFGEIAKRAMADVDTRKVHRVVIDLRWNGGGNETVIGPLKSGLASRLKALGHVYVLIGPGTFSSAVDNAVDLRQSLSATLVGEPTGGMPGGYGQVSTFTLPNSQLVVRFTTKRWDPAGGGLNTLTPDVAAPLRLADVLVGRDPALDAAIAGRR
jgi:Peptidase family S41